MQKYELIPNYEELSQTRFFKYVVKTDTCWLWSGAQDSCAMKAFERLEKRRQTKKRNNNA